MRGSIGNKIDYELHPDGYVIEVARDDIEVEVDDAIQLLDVASRHFEAPYGLISNRLHDYSTDLGVYELVEQRKDLVAMAVVLYHGHSFPAAKLETRYLRKTAYATFFVLEPAEAWMRDRLARKRRR